MPEAMPNHQQSRDVSSLAMSVNAAQTSLPQEKDGGMRRQQPTASAVALLPRARRALLPRLRPRHLQQKVGTASRHEPAREAQPQATVLQRHRQQQPRPHLHLLVESMMHTVHRRKAARAGSLPTRRGQVTPGPLPQHLQRQQTRALHLHQLQQRQHP